MRFGFIGGLIGLAALAWAASGPQLTLRDSEGLLHSSDEWSHARATVIFFVTTDCPLSNGYAPEMNRLEQAYAPKGVRFLAVQGDATIPDADVRQHAKDYAYRFPVLLDPKESLAHYTGATITPEAAVLSPTGEVVYLGRIDNRVEDFGKVRYEPTEFDLRNALDAILAGRPVAHPRTHAFGCSIVPAS